MQDRVEGERRWGVPSCCKTQWKGREDEECLAVARHSGRGDKIESAKLLQGTVEGERRRGVPSCRKTQWKGREYEECLAVARHSGRGEKAGSA